MKFQSSLVPRLAAVAALWVVASTAAAQVQTTPPAGYQNYFVDKRHGCNANNGLTPATAWQDLSYGYAQLPPMSVLNVGEGYYTTATGEAFPIQMKAQCLITGRNTFTTIVGETGSTNLFHFYSGTGGPYLPGDGPYLSRLTLRGANIGVDLSGGVLGGGDCEPLLHTLAIYECATAIRGEICGPHVYDCSISLNTNGLLKLVFIPDDCATWEVVNSIVRDNSGTDLTNIDRLEITHSDFATAVIGAGPAAFCSYVVPCHGAGPGCNNNVNLPPGYVNAAPSPTPIPPSNAIPEFDFRLAPTSPLRGLGVASGVPDDGEGVGNPRTLPYNASSVIVEAPDIGADEYDLLQIGPLARGIEHADPYSACTATANVKCGADSERMSFRTDGESSDHPWLGLHDYFVLPVPPVLPPITYAPPIFGSLYIVPKAPFVVCLVDVTGNPCVTLNGSTAVNVPFPIPAVCGGGAPGIPTFGGACVPLATAFAGGWRRATVQNVHLNNVSGVVKISNYQEYGLVY
jgi:hypothetical protein